MTQQKKSPTTGTTRDGFGQGLVAAAESNPNIVGLCADLTESTRMDAFRDAFPDRFIEVGVAEENMAGLAAGLALSGKIPVISSYASFSPANSWGVIRSSICYSNLPVKIHGGHSGLVTGEDGATHQALEDIALTQVLPNMSVIVPADQGQAFAATKAMIDVEGPCYIRTSKYPVSEVTKGHSFTFGKAQILRKGRDITFIACGTMVERALEAAKQMSSDIDATVLNVHTIKPLDVSTIIQSIAKTTAVVIAEEHQQFGGLGSAVSAAIVQSDVAACVEIVAMKDTFGESGDPAALIKKYGLDVPALIQAGERALTRKKDRK